MSENLMFGYLGNGVTVCDRNRERSGDYLTVAHIDHNRQVTYYKHDMSEAARGEIEDFARAGNMPVSACQPDVFALQPLNTADQECQQHQQHQKQSAI